MPQNLDLEYQAKAEISVDLLIAMLKNPSVDVTNRDLPDIAVNHAIAILESLDAQSGGNH